MQNQDQLLVGNSSDVNESESIDINATNLKNHVANAFTDPSDRSAANASEVENTFTTSLDRPGSLPPDDESPHAFTDPSDRSAANAYVVENIFTTSLDRPGSLPPDDESPHAFTDPSDRSAANAYVVENIFTTSLDRPGSLPPDDESPHAIERLRRLCLQL
eukprot:g9121.t1